MVGRRLLAPTRIVAIAVMVAISVLSQERAYAEGESSCSILRLAHDFGNVTNSESAREIVRNLSMCYAGKAQENDVYRDPDVMYLVASILLSGSTSFVGDENLKDERTKFLDESKALFKQAADEGHEDAKRVLGLAK